MLKSSKDLVANRHCVDADCFHLSIIKEEWGTLHCPFGVVKAKTPIIRTSNNDLSRTWSRIRMSWWPICIIKPEVPVFRTLFEVPIAQSHSKRRSNH
ncbi:hypothetical protein HanPSC8_Chr16g0715591 [Helianthus annuus]|nr:hypothetical protein HanPSC8_Chr16g0715591 [Helianthus annuus]